MRPNESPEPNLKQRLEAKPDAANSLPQGVDRADRLDEAEYDQHSRAERFRAEKHWKNKILPKLHWLLFGAICIFVAVFVILLAAYLCDLLGLCKIPGDAEAVGALLGRIWETALISLATLCLQRLWPK